MTTDDPVRREVQDQTFRMVDRVDDAGLIEDTNFERCTILGPALLLILEAVEIRNCQFEAEGLDDLFWVVPARRPRVTGGVGLNRVTFEECTFRQIGLGVSEDRYNSEEFRRGFGLPDDSPF